MVADPAIDLRVLVRRRKWVERGRMVMVGSALGSWEKWLVGMVSGGAGAARERRGRRDRHRSQTFSQAGAVRGEGRRVED